jgi:Carboxypeptidase regulatory-like domain
MKSVTSQMARNRKTVYVLSVVVDILLFSLSLFAQGNFGRILGTITDQSGAVIGGATVSIIDTQRGLARTLTTDQAGEYNAPTLIPGIYTVRVEASGFKRLERPKIVLEVGQEIRVDLTPQPGEQSQTVTVEALAPAVDTTTATLGGALSNAEVNDLPLNGRNYQNLLGLRPGIMVQPGGSPWTQSTNNVRPEETAWMMDGVINVNFYDSRPIGNSPSAFTDAATIIPIDAIQEFNTQENPKAEYGWKPGAVVNVGIRSGTNTYHGSAYAFGRDVNWDARSIFNLGPTPGGTCGQNTAVPSVCDKLPAELEQFGAVVGGRIKKDKLFFFAGYEGLRSNIGQIQVVQIPETGSQPGGDPKNSMVDAITALQAAGVPVSPVSLKLLGCTTGATVACTGGLFAGASANSTNYAVPFPNTNVSDNWIGKIDYNINSKHRISGMLWTGAYSANGYDHPIVNALWTTGITIHTWSTVENWIWIPSSAVVNEFRFGYNRGGQAFTIGDQGFHADGSGGLCTATGCGGKGYPLNTGVTRTGGLPFIQFGGFGGGGGLGNGNGNRPGANGPSPYYDYQDSVSYLRGKHALKIGGEFAHIQADQATQNFRGNLILFKGGQTSQITCPSPNDPTQLVPCSTSLEDFFAGNPAKGIINIGDGVRQMTWRKYAGFVQDDWRIKPTLMLNLGLRYEYASPIREVNNLWSNFDPNSQFGLVQQGQPGVGDSLVKPDRKNFSPRVGFAWDATGKGTTVVRGGASVIYSSYFARIFMDNGAQNGGNGNVAQNPTGACRTTVPVGGSCPSGGTFGGKINLGQPTFAGSNLNWDPAVNANPGLNGGVVFPQGTVSCTVDSQCNLFAVNPNLKTPFVVTYSLNIQHTITSNLSLEVGYVGTHGDNLLAIRDINQCVPNPDPSVCDSGISRPFNAKFPYLQYIELTSNYDRSNYNSLQATLTKRVSHGLNFTAGYTYGHGLDNGSLNFNGQNPQDSRNTNAEYASSDFDIRHRLTVTASYAIPGKKGFGQILQGWKLNTIVTLQSAQPWGMYDLTNNFSMGGSGGGEFSDRWNFYGNPNDFRSSSSSLPYCTDPSVPGGGCSVTSSISGIQSFFSPAQSTAMWAQCTAVAPDPSTLNAPTGGCYVKGKSVMTPPLNGTFGTMGRNIFRDSGFKNVDFSVFKDFRWRERFNAQFRAEVFNILNHPNIANPYGSSNTSLLGADPSNNNHFGCGCATPDVAAGNPLIGSGSQRVMQLGLKLVF